MTRINTKNTKFIIFNPTIKGLKKGHIKLLAFIEKYNDNETALPTQATVAEKIEVTQGTISRYIRKLITSGLIRMDNNNYLVTPLYRRTCPHSELHILIEKYKDFLTIERLQYSILVNTPNGTSQSFSFLLRQAYPDLIKTTFYNDNEVLIVADADNFDALRKDLLNLMDIQDSNF